MPLAAPPAIVRPLAPAAKITGAAINERQACAVITVTPATVRAGLLKAQANLQAGVPTRVVFEPGVYRADASDLKWDAGKAHDTLLILEGTPGKTVLSGADVFPLSTWKRQGDLLVHDWPYRFGNFAPFWGPPNLIAYRREMAFVGNGAMRPEVLETYKIGGLGNWSSGGVTYEYTGLRDPAKTLTPGSFGVTERPENGGRIYLRPPTGARLTEDAIQVSVRPMLLRMGAKHNLVLRGLDFVRCATPMPDAAPDAPVLFAGGESLGPGNVLIDRCRFLWNSGSALQIAGRGWTIRDSVFNHNGLSGISTGGDCADVVFDGCETSFNCWRAWRGGENDWSFGGIKMHGTDGQRLTRHLSLANCSTGLWWDVYCGRVDVEDSVSLANANCDLKWELGQGPFHGRRLVLAGGKMGADYAATNVGDGLLEDSVIYHDYSPPGGKDPGAVAGLLSYPRDDPHAARRPIPRGVYGLRNCLLVAGPRTPLLVRAEWWGADPLFHFRTDFAGNVYAAPGRRAVFQVHLSDAGPQTTDMAGFARQSGDASARLMDPKFRAPADYDFRLAPDSPVHGWRGPSYKLPAAKRREMQQFFAWLRVGPDGPGAPPTGEP